MITAPGQRLLAGDRVGRYELLFPLASGGQGEVWVGRLLAEHGFEKFFVLKFMLPETAHGQLERSMFLDEARLAARISHPNVAQVFELAEARGLLYMVMERVEGDSLSRLVRNLGGAGRPSEIPLGVSLRVLADVCDGLHAAHEARDAEGRPLGLVHRDVSPQNILVSLTGHAKIIDFGVAKAKVRLSADTSSATIKGKLRYVAPEQAATAPDVDRRADLWSVGVVLFRLVTGGMPVDGETDAEVLNRLLSIRQPLLLPDGSPEVLARIVARTLAPARADRYSTALELKQALEAALGELAPGTSHEDVSAFFGPALIDVAFSQSQALASAEAALVGRDQAGGLAAVAEGAGASASGLAAHRHPARLARWLILAAVLVVGVAAASFLVAGREAARPSDGQAVSGAVPPQDVELARAVPRGEPSSTTGVALPEPVRPTQAPAPSAARVPKPSPAARPRSGNGLRALDNPYQ